MKFGWATQIITPTLPFSLAGYAGVRKAESILDDLYVRIVLFEDAKIALINYDLIGVDHCMIDLLKQAEVLKEYQLFVCATHTHSGCGGVLDVRQGVLKSMAYIMQDNNEAIVQQILHATIQAVVEAKMNTQKGKIWISSDQLEGIGTNRNDPNLPSDAHITTLYLKHQEKQVILLNYACHPTILNAQNCAVSADLYGAILPYLAPKTAFVMTLNGSCGDISTRFTRQKSDIEEVKRMGKILADKIQAMQQQAVQLTYVTMSLEHQSYTLKVKKILDVPTAQNQWKQAQTQLDQAKKQNLSASELRRLESYVEGASAMLHLAKCQWDQEMVEIEVQYLKINDHLFIGLPGECYSQLSNPYVSSICHFVGYTNGYVGYFADEKAYDAGYYEALISPFEKAESEKLMHQIANYCTRLKI